jgi:hypothetical protein
MLGPFCNIVPAAVIYVLNAIFTSKSRTHVKTKKTQPPPSNMHDRKAGRLDVVSRFARTSALGCVAIFR